MSYKVTGWNELKYLKFHFFKSKLIIEISLPNEKLVLK